MRLKVDKYPTPSHVPRTTWRKFAAFSKRKVLAKKTWFLAIKNIHLNKHQLNTLIWKTLRLVLNYLAEFYSLHWFSDFIFHRKNNHLKSMRHLGMQDLSIVSGRRLSNWIHSTTQGSWKKSHGQPPGIFWNPVNDVTNYEPQLVSRFSEPSTISFTYSIESDSSKYARDDYGDDLLIYKKRCHIIAISCIILYKVIAIIMRIANEITLNEGDLHISIMMVKRLLYIYIMHEPQQK